MIAGDGKVVDNRCVCVSGCVCGYLKEKEQTEMYINNLSEWQ